MKRLSPVTPDVRPSGEGLVWLTSMGVATGLVMIAALMLLIVVNGVGYFWPNSVLQVQLSEDSRAAPGGHRVIAASIVESRLKKVTTAPATREVQSGETDDSEQSEVAETAFEREIKFFLGNRDVYGDAFFWVDESAIVSQEVASGIMMAERLTGGNAIFRPVELMLAGGETLQANAPNFLETLRVEIRETRLRQQRVDRLSMGPIGRLARKMNDLDLQARMMIRQHPEQQAAITATEAALAGLNRGISSAGLTWDTVINLASAKRGNWGLADGWEWEAQTLRPTVPKTAAIKASLVEFGGWEELQSALGQLAQPEVGRADTAELQRLRGLLARRAAILAENATYAAEVRVLQEANQRVTLTYELMGGERRTLPIGAIRRVWLPNELTFFEKIGYFLSQGWAFLSEPPRSSNTEGGVFPAIFGTFVMTVLMSALVMPFGVIAAIYLREYAVQGPFVQAIRIAINNLAGVPSIVYGVFGLGFFVYFVGDGFDWLFFPDRHALNEPVFGTGGVLWASLTLALMTIPVVVVATEEALAAVPRGMREASLACGASKWQTIQRIVLPGSASGILTGLILAMARGAGEVAPLMVVGVIKFAPTLPVDGEFPFFHLERKFMHLGFHIYDLGFQSPDAEAVKPLVFATTLLLIALVVVLNLSAILIRDHLRKKYSSSSF